MSKRDLFLGFSEYVAYASWLLEFKPDRVKVMDKPTWRRMTPLRRPGMLLTSFFRRDGLCCPTRFYLWYRMWQGLDYVGWEIGHMPGCRFNSPRFEHSYGVSSHS